MYLAGGSEGSGFSTTNALNALLQSEINNIAGKALETIDLSLGVDQETTAEGTSRTDYSFRFAKRFWGNRVSVIVGGKVSTGENVENTGSRSSTTSRWNTAWTRAPRATSPCSTTKATNRCWKAEITEMGAGLVLRRKMTRLGELFIFKNRKKRRTAASKNREMMKTKLKICIMALLCGCLWTGCSTTKNLPEEEVLYTGIEEIDYGLAAKKKAKKNGKSSKRKRASSPPSPTPTRPWTNCCRKETSPP